MAFSVTRPRAQVEKVLLGSSELSIGSVTMVEDPLTSECTTAVDISSMCDKNKFKYSDRDVCDRHAYRIESEYAPLKEASEAFKLTHIDAVARARIRSIELSSPPPSPLLAACAHANNSLKP
jgi:hypothetical protein